MFTCTDKPLEFLPLKDGLASRQAGCLICYDGIVRGHNHGREVLALETSGAEEPCRWEAEKILQEAMGRFDILQVKCYYRKGKVPVGEMLFWIGVSAAHRDAAFSACRYVIDEIKTRFPVRKDEYYA
ncbi:MAG: molybdenum cofactor biosynthesis protein MoaE [Candidatus Omnitrophota bacterium]